MRAIIFWKMVFPENCRPFLRTLRPQKVKNMLTCWPIAAAPVAIMKAARTRSTESRIIW